MKYTVENVKGSKCKIEFSLDKKEWDEAYDAAYIKNRSKYNIQGFRKGHAPRGIIEKHLGKGLFVEDAINIVFPKFYKIVLDENQDIVPVSTPTLDLVSLQPQVIFVAQFDTKPEVTLGKYVGLIVERPKVNITVDEVDAELLKVQDKLARKVAVNREIKQDDFVIFDFTGSVDGVKFDGGTAKDFELKIGSGQFIPGFEEQLKGLSLGATKDVKVTFPKDYHATDLAGKDAVFECKISEIKEEQRPTLDDEFAKDVSVFDTMVEYRADIERKLNEEAVKKSEIEIDNKLLNAVVEQTVVDIPQSMVESQIDYLIDGFDHMLQGRGLSLNQYMSMTNTSMTDLRAHHQKEALLAVRVRLTVESILKKEDIKCDEREVDLKLKTIADDNKMTLEEIKKVVDEGKLDLEQVQYSVRVDKLQKFLRDKNTIVEQNIASDAKNSVVKSTVKSQTSKAVKGQTSTTAQAKGVQSKSSTAKSAKSSKTKK
ncbi:MAG: trigger factor [Clostridiales bacterium]|jgi:trigger factor|nr:trigger factor [Clostridiales bacterium]